MRVDYIPLGTKVIYQGHEYETNAMVSYALGTIRISGNGPADYRYVKVAELNELKEANDEPTP